MELLRRSTIWPIWRTGSSDRSNGEGQSVPVLYEVLRLGDGFYYYGYRYYNPSVGRWLSRDPLEEEGGVNLYGFVRNDPLRFVDPFGLRIYVMAPDVGGLDFTHFDDYVLEGFQKIIGDCAKLHKTPIFRQSETGTWLWKRTETRLVGWELYYTDQNRNCICNPCWKTLRNALGDSLPSRNVYIIRAIGPSSWTMPPHNIVPMELVRLGSMKTSTVAVRA